MEETKPPATLRARGGVETAGASGRASVGEVSSIVRSPNTQIGSPAAMSTKEDWLYIATADPAFWLNEVKEVLVARLSSLHDEE